MTVMKAVMSHILELSLLLLFSFLEVDKSVEVGLVVVAAEVVTRLFSKSVTSSPIQCINNHKRFV